MPPSTVRPSDYDAESQVHATVSAAPARPLSLNTCRAYEADWHRFVTWCAQEGHDSLPAQPHVVADYLRSGATRYAPATVMRRAAAISHLHRRAGYPSPTASNVVAAAIARIKSRRANASQQTARRAAPLRTDDLVAIIEFARKSTTGWTSEVYERRDSALLLIGYAGALSRAQLVALTCADVPRRQPHGIELRIAPHDRAGSLRPLPASESHETCPPCAVVRWLQVVAAFDAGGRRAAIRLLKTSEIFDRHVCGSARSRARASAPLFRSISRNGNISATALAGSSVHRVIRHRAQLAGFDEAFVATLGVHSLRTGFITQAWSNGADTTSIMRQTGHANPSSVQRYVAQDLGVHNAVVDLGL
ncbi:tyrosine-type recombinase/integrase [Mycobacterium sp. URHB0021]